MTTFDRVKDTRRRRLASGFSVVSFVMLLVASLAMLFSLLLSYGNVRTMYVVSNSMLPTFAQNDLLLVSLKPNAIHVDDIVAYEADWADGKIVTHRVVNVDGEILTTRGDNNNSNDPEFNRDKVHGEVVSILPYMGYLFNPVTIWILAIGGVILSFIGDAIRPIARRAAKSKMFWSNTKKKSVINLNETLKRAPETIVASSVALASDPVVLDVPIDDETVTLNDREVFTEEAIEPVNPFVEDIEELPEIIFDEDETV